MRWFPISDMWNSVASDFPILCQFCQVTYLSGFYDVFSSHHTACDIFSRTPDDKLGALEQKEVPPCPPKCGSHQGIHCILKHAVVA